MVKAILIFPLLGHSSWEEGGLIFQGLLRPLRQEDQAFKKYDRGLKTWNLLFSWAQDKLEFCLPGRTTDLHVNFP